MNHSNLNPSPHIAIVGNPNCGKTTLFNALTGAKQKVGNWSGVTVDKKKGTLLHENKTFEIIDLPGIYSLTASDENALDEQIACQYLIQNKPDLIVNILDAANLERNLYLTLQLIEMQIPMILVINMTDIAKQKGIVIHFDALEKMLGIPVIPMICRKGAGLTSLKNQLLKPQFKPNIDLNAHYPKNLIRLKEQLSTFPTLANYPLTWIALQSIEGDQLATHILNTHNIPLQSCGLNEIEVSTVSTARYQLIDQIIQASTNTLESITHKHKLTEALDWFCMHRYFGIPLFLFIMYLMFEFSITVGAAIQPLFDDASNIIFIQYLSHTLINWNTPTWIVAIIGQGFGLGINTVLSFVPQIGCMFLFLSFLEDSGYMARAAFVMDRFMQSIGLPGKAFVPLIVGFGCNVPAVMGTRTLETRRDRLLSIMMSPFISCGARLAIFVVFAAAFFPEHGADVIFLLYVIGIVGAILTGFVIKSTLLKGDNTPFIMEIPLYHLPNFKTIFLHAWQRLKRFIFRAGKVIVPICLIIGTLNTIQLDGAIVADGSRHSVLAKIGRTITPIFSPLGIQQDNWPATVGLLTGTLAKEVVVGTLNTLYSQAKPETLESMKGKPFDLWNQLKGTLLDSYQGLVHINPAALANPFVANEADANMDQSSIGEMVTSFSSLAAAFAYLLFVLLYVPCVATIGAIAREANKAWAWMSVIWSTALAYFAAVIVYQTTLLLSHPASASSWILISFLCLYALIQWMKYMAQHASFKVKPNIACLSGNGKCSTKTCTAPALPI